MNIAKRLLDSVPSVRYALAFMLVLSLLAGVFIIGQAYSLAQIIAGVFLDRQGLAQVSTMALVLLLVMVARAMVQWGNEVVAHVAASGSKRYLRNRLYKHLLLLGPAYTQREQSGEIANTFVEGAEALDGYFSQYLPQLIAALCIPLLVLVTIFLIDPLSGVILLFTAPALPILLALVGMESKVVTRRQWTQMGQLSAHFLDVMQGLVTLKLFGRSKAQQATIRHMSDRFGRMTMKVLLVAFLSSFVLELGSTICTAIIAVEIGFRLLYGYLPFEQAFFVLLLTPEFFQPLRMLGTRFHASMAGSAAAERIFALLEEPVSQVAKEQNGGVPTVKQSLHFEDVAYAYKSVSEQTGSDVRPALKGISFTVKRGQTVALVGPSGAGKSTVAHLLLRFIEPERGRVLADGVPLQTVSAQEWRKMVAWVPQRPYLFNASIAENIRLGHADATMDEVMQAARQANLHAFIQSLPQGYDTLIGERGARLSGGQVQRLSLARAFLKDAPVLILDEATSHLDLENEAVILSALDTLMAERMVLIIAHRLHTIEQADQIVLFDEGNVLATGTHQELIDTNPLYQKLVAAYHREEVMV